MDDEVLGAAEEEELHDLGQRPDLLDGVVEQPVVPVTDVVTVLPFDVLAGHLGDQPVAAHADGPVDAPQRHLHVVRRKRLGPDHDVLVDGVDQGAVHVEHDRVVAET